MYSENINQIAFGPATLNHEWDLLIVARAFEMNYSNSSEFIPQPPSSPNYEEDSREEHFRKLIHKQIEMKFDNFLQKQKAITQQRDEPIRDRFHLQI